MRQHLSRLATAVAAVALILGGARPATEQPPAPSRGIERVNGREAAAREVLVKFKDGATPADAASAVDADTVRPVGRAGVRRLRSRSVDASTLLRILAARPDVAYAEPNFVVRAFVEPPDPLMPQLWGLSNVGQAVNGGVAGHPGSDVHAEAAWDVSLGSTAHVVAVVDTGIDYTHPDLAENMWSAPAPFSVTIGGVTLTCPAGSHGFNAITFACDPMDDHNHGTHVSGTIGAAGNNGLGVVGVNWTTRIMGIKFLGADGSGTVADAVNGIEFAIQARQAFAASAGADVRVLSNSWGGRDFSQALQDEIALTNNENMLFVAAAGNDGFSNDWLPAYPASYDVPNVVAVAATTNTDSRAWFSNYGVNSVHLGAPGVDILSTTIGNTYAFSSGTSMAAPHVSGAAALVLSRCDLDTPALKQVLLSTVEPVAALASYTITGGRLDVNNALRSCIGPPASAPELTASAGNGSVALSWSAVGGTTGYRLKRALASGGPYPTLATVTARTYTDTAVTNGTTYYYVVTATNPAGEGPDSAEASATPKFPSDLVVSTLTVPSVGGSGEPLSVSETTRNQGTGPSVPTTTRIYLSSNSVLDGSDTPLGAGHAVPALAPGAQSSVSFSAGLPAGLTSGYYYVIAKADADGVETETQEYNNQTTRLVTIGPDLTLSSLTVPTAAGAGSSVVVTDTVKNQGGGAAAASAVRYYLSANWAFDPSDTELQGSRSVPALVPGAVSTGSASVTIPASVTAGTYYLMARSDAGEVVSETQESNNTASRLLQVGGDLVVSTMSVPLRGGSGMPMLVSDSTKNNGAGSIGPSITRFYLSVNSLLDASDVLLAGGRPVPALAAGATSTGSTTVTLPTGLAPATYFVIARADADNVVAETQETNNALSRSVSVGPDLTVSGMTVGYSNAAGSAVPVVTVVSNPGGEAAGPSATRFYLSVNLTIDASDVLLDATQPVPMLSAGQSGAFTTTVVIPAGTAPGAWFLMAKADADGVVAESQEGNNTAARAIQVTP